jgi:hypothetical protein
MAPTNQPGTDAGSAADGHASDAVTPADAGPGIDTRPDTSPVPEDASQGSDVAIDVSANDSGPDSSLSDVPGSVDSPPVPCPAGTERVGAICTTPGPLKFEVRLGATQIPADGYSRVPVLVVATAQDGSPALTRVLLSLTRPEAGVFDRDALDLTMVGGNTYFIPCSSALFGCLGKTRVQIALASDPTTILATSTELELTLPTSVGSPAACLTGGNVMVFDGNDYIYKGVLTVTNAVFSTSGSSMVDLQLSVNPRDATQGSNWRLWFSSAEIGQPLREQVYRDAERAPFESPGHPGIDISGSGRGCNTIKGSFQIDKLVWAGNQLKEVTIVFDQHCEGGSTSLRGCIHIGP